jgi:hypothetical protein
MKTFTTPIVKVNKEIEFNKVQLLISTTQDEIVLCTGTGEYGDEFEGVVLQQAVCHRPIGYSSNHWFRKSFMKFNDQLNIVND